MPLSAAETGLADRASRPPEGSVDNLVDGYRRALEALGDMQRHRVLPTAPAYELFLTYRAGVNPLLTQRMTEVLGSGQPITAAVIEALRQEFDLGTSAACGDAPDEHLLDVSNGLHDAAEDLIQHATQGRVAIHQYGEVLAQGVVQLGSDTSRSDSMRVIAMLSAETVKMAEHNRELREQLATTSARVERLRRMLADQRQAATTDQLTGLANRRAFDTRVKRALAKNATESGAGAALLLMDVDHFKRFNDMYGHNTGDLVLRLVGRMLFESIKGRDIAARYGGEEFGVLLVGADLDAAASVARQICTSLATKRFKVATTAEQGQGRVTISIGVAQLRAADSLASLVDRADAALYAAKRAGRNRVMTERDAIAAPAV